MVPLISCYFALLLMGNGVHGFARVNHRLQSVSTVTNFHRPKSTAIPNTRWTTTTNLQALPTTLATTLEILRGGAAGAAEVALDMGRENMKLSSMALYTTITALIMNACLRLYTSQKFEFGHDQDGKRPRSIQILESIFTATSIVCIVCGVYTSVLFCVLGIYSREALWMNNIEGYLLFQQATAVLRKWGFRSFLMTSLSFLTCFLTSVVEKTSNEDRAGQIILVVSILLVLAGCFKIHTVLTLATKYIYTAAACAKNHVA